MLTAHPDDEVFAHGAAIAMLSQQGSRVVLCTASGGEAAETDVDSSAEARRRRAARLDAACTRLGVSEWNWLAEGRWTDTAGRQMPGSLTSASVADLAEVITVQIHKIIPDVVLTVGPDGLTGHPDHILIHQSVASVAASCEVPVFGSYLLPADIGTDHEWPDALCLSRDHCTNASKETIREFFEGSIAQLAELSLKAILGPGPTHRPRQVTLRAFSCDAGCVRAASSSPAPPHRACGAGPAVLAR
ncbi:PIG-L family deacetylase [Streptomyces sp. NPDC102476]|uniref:PIG-L family deacetylase n=1 Tax=Streptomyces sp. NPDC102476 TaxID=3366181 RepID=UPI00382D9F77